MAVNSFFTLVEGCVWKSGRLTGGREFGWRQGRNLCLPSRRDREMSFCRQYKVKERCLQE